MKTLQTRKLEAEDRTKEYKKLTTTQKILMLDLKLGDNKGAKKQRERLSSKLIEEKEAKSKVSTGQIPEGVGDSVNKKKPYQKPKKS